MAARQAESRKSLSELLSGISQVLPKEDIFVSHLSLDSRKVGPDGLFLACRGARGHGLDHAQQAANQGAAAVICEAGGGWSSSDIAGLRHRLGVPVLEVGDLKGQSGIIASRFHGDPSAELEVIGITGTNGKTSCCHFIAQALDGDGGCGIVGTLGIGFPGELLPTSHTTPDAVALQAAFADLRGRGARAVAMEVSSHALDQGRVGAVHFEIAVLTNLSRDHLDYHDHMEGYAAAKQRLFKIPGLACAILNFDDPFGRDILAGLDDATNVVLYGLHRPAKLPARAADWVWARSVEASSNGLRILLSASSGEGVLETPLLGRFNASNMLAALAVLLRKGWSLDRAIQKLSALHTVPGRMEGFGQPGQPRVVVDYAHTPDALEKVLEALRPHCRGRLYCVFGCGGDRDRGKRPLMGGVAERLSDFIVLTDDNPRREAGDRIIEDIQAGMTGSARVRVQRDRGLAIKETVAGAGPDDLVLVAGKGHETVQIAGDLSLPFSDREQVVRALNERARPTI